MTLKAGVLITVLCGLPLLAPATARADYIYQYEGSTFNYGLSGGTGSTYTPPTENLSATLDSLTMLAPNTTYSFGNPVVGSSSFVNSSVSLGSQTCTTYGPCGFGGSITTNANGAISSWGFGIDDNSGFSNLEIHGSSTATTYSVPSTSGFPGPEFYYSVPLYDVKYASNGLLGPDYVEGSTTPGTWSVSVVPLPSTVWLLLGGLGALGLWSRRRPILL